LKRIIMRNTLSVISRNTSGGLISIHSVVRKSQPWQIVATALLTLAILLPISTEAQMILAPNSSWTVLFPSSWGNKQMPIGNGNGFSAGLPAPNSVWNPIARLLDLKTTIDLTGYDPSLVYYSIAIDDYYQLSVNGTVIDSLDYDCGGNGNNCPAVWGPPQNILAKAAAQGVTLNPGVNTIEVQIANENLDDGSANGYFAMQIYATNATFVAVTSDSSGKAAYSFDGMNWSASTLPNTSGWSAVCYGNGEFVAIPQSGSEEAYSTNGIDWIGSSSSGTLSGYWHLAYGSGHFVAIPAYGNDAQCSSDGLHWVPSVTGLPAEGYWSSVAYGNYNYVAVAYASANPAYSEDCGGVYWGASGQPPANNYSWNGVAYGNGLFVAVAGNGSVATSPDGNDWTSGSIPSGSGWSSVAFGNGIFAAVAADGSVASSTDGINWAVGSSVLSPASGWGNVTFGVANGSGIFVAVQNGGAGAAFSVDGISWSLSAAGMPSAQAWSSVAARAGVTFVAVTSDNSGKAAFSTDGIDWSASTLPNTLGSSAVCYGNGQFVAIPQSGSEEACSTNGFNWVGSSSSGSLSGYWHLAYGSGQFVAVPAYGDDAQCSSDGLHWVPSVTGLPTEGYWSSVAYGNYNYVAVAYAYANPAYSENNGGVYWGASGQPPANNYSWNGVAYGDGLFVAVAGNGSVATSPDGNDWTSGSIPSGSGWSSVAFGNGIFAAVAADGSVASSTGGINWTVGSSVLSPASGWGNVTFGSGLFVAVQNGGAATAFSKDGVNWFLSRGGMPSAQAWSSVTVQQ
jgi:hypothetical protein